ncbi:MAG: hypothetical protein JSV94_00450 [Methanobacteriota archaeon]|nr:MAG: hypothetical protein JSV94_00450 [Euryarchaeota archaeon]
MTIARRGLYPYPPAEGNMIKYSSTIGGLNMLLEIAWTRKALSLTPKLRDEVDRRVRRLHPYFPEIRRKMKIGLTRSYDGLALQSDDGVVKLMLDVRKARNGDYRSPTFWTIAHELMHLAQFNTNKIPAGERACDLHTLARLPPKYIDEAPSYLVIAKNIRRNWNSEYASLAHEIARQALRKRTNGVRNYIAWWEEKFDNRAT